MSKNEFDIIIIGSGLSESIIAAALSYHYNVLQIDSQYYYNQSVKFKEIVKNMDSTLDLKFNDILVDLHPKLFLSMGETLDLLRNCIAASKYLEFKLITKSFVFLHDSKNWIQNPVSKEDIFLNTNISNIDKRRLMKFLIHALQFQPDEIIKQELFIDYLKNQNITHEFQLVIIDAIAQIDPLIKNDVDTITGLELTQKYLKSLNRYGPSAFLTTCYGSGELSQAFCRVCAVNGGTFMLNQKFSNPKFIKEENKFKISLIDNSEFENVTSKILIIGGDDEKVILETLNETESTTFEKISLNSSIIEQDEQEEKYYYISHALLATDYAIIPAQNQFIQNDENLKMIQEDGTILYIVPGNDKEGIEKITAIQTSWETGQCPKGTYLLHVWCLSRKDSNSEQDLKLFIKDLLKSHEQISKSNETKELESIIYYKDKHLNPYYKDKHDKHDQHSYDKHSYDKHLNNEYPNLIKLSTYSPHILTCSDSNVLESRKVFKKCLNLLNDTKCSCLNICNCELFFPKIMDGEEVQEIQEILKEIKSNQ